MNRRKFLRNGSLAGLAASVSITACNTPGEKAEEKTAPADSNAPFTDTFELNEVTIDELQQKMQNGTHTSRSITELYLKRIADIDKAGPAINAIIELNPDALAIADNMDAERKAGKMRSPLHGIPILIKDNIDTGDKMMTTAGSLALDGHKAAADAFVIKQLRAAGVVLLGKTNLSEWANFRSTHSTSGWSSRGGQTKNPCVLDRNPCGSSSGSGAAVAANLCAVAVGTETDGSVIAPASFNGIVGIKPTVGLVSRAGIIPISKTQDTAGPMARTVKDAAILLSAMTGIDAADAVTSESAGKAQKDYTSFLDVNGLQGKRIGVQKASAGGVPAVVALYTAALDLLKSKGATIVEIDLFDYYNKLGDAETTMMEYEFKDGLNKYLLAANAGVKSLADVIAFNKKNEEKAMPYFKQELLESSEEKGDLTSKGYLIAVKKTTGSRKVIDDFLQKNKLDAIAGISIGPANCTDWVNGDYGTGFYFCPPAATAGYPHITVPMGAVLNLPVGFSFMAGAYQEGEVIKLGYAYEQASKKRTAPKFLKTIS